MSVVLTYTKAHDLAQLHQELLAAGLAPERVEGERVEVVTPDPDPDQGDVVTYEDRITLTMPDGVDEPAIAAIVAAHVPQTRYDPATRLAEVAALRRESGRAALLARTRAATTVADLKAVVLAHLRAEEEAEA